MIEEQAGSYDKSYNLHVYNLAGNYLMKEIRHYTTILVLVIPMVTAKDIDIDRSASVQIIPL